MQKAILYQAYGGEDYINECKYSLLKYLQVYGMHVPQDVTICIYTDQAKAFADFRDVLPLQTIDVTSERVKYWRGEIDFVHRVKIEMMKDFLEHHPATKLLYLDTDAYITKPITDLFQQLDKGHFFMHEFEGKIGSEASFRKWKRFLSTSKVIYQGNELHYTPNLKMWNAGVIGITSVDINVLDTVLALTDAIYRQFPKHIAEQFAFSYCFQKAGDVKTAGNWVAHYWNLKEFRALLRGFFLKNGQSIAQMVDRLRNINAIAIYQDKEDYKNMSVAAKALKTLTGSRWHIDNYKKLL